MELLTLILAACTTAGSGSTSQIALDVKTRCISTYLDCVGDAKFNHTDGVYKLEACIVKESKK